MPAKGTKKVKATTRWKTLTTIGGRKVKDLTRPTPVKTHYKKTTKKRK